MSDAYCLFCHKNIREEGGILESIFTDDVLCSECRMKMGIKEKKIKVEDIEIMGLYPYTGCVRDMMLQYKEYNDEALFPSFLYRKKKQLKQKYKDYCLVTIPSSKESLERRGFDHVKMIYSLLELPFVDYLSKTEDIQQKNQSVSDRQEIIYFMKCNDIDLTDKKVLVVDDIVTSGYSMLSAATLLKGKCKHLSFMTICYSERYLNNIEQCIKKMYNKA